MKAEAPGHALAQCSAQSLFDAVDARWPVHGPGEDGSRVPRVKILKHGELLVLGCSSEFLWEVSVSGIARHFAVKESVHKSPCTRLSLSRTYLVIFVIVSQRTP